MLETANLNSKIRNRTILFFLIIFFAFEGPVFAIYCNQCGHKNPDGANFCSKCGAALAGENQPGEMTFKSALNEINEIFKRSCTEYKFRIDNTGIYTIAKESYRRKTGKDKIYITKWDKGKDKDWAFAVNDQMSHFSVKRNKKGIFICVGNPRCTGSYKDRCREFIFMADLESAERACELLTFAR